jgi:hypothetical protein
MIALLSDKKAGAFPRRLLQKSDRPEQSERSRGRPSKDQTKKKPPGECRTAN